jgi:hypothetical protein
MLYIMFPPKFPSFNRHFFCRLIPECLLSNVDDAVENCFYSRHREAQIPYIFRALVLVLLLFPQWLLQKIFV